MIEAIEAVSAGFVVDEVALGPAFLPEPGGFPYFYHSISASYAAFH
jgi:hypothetical protein